MAKIDIILTGTGGAEPTYYVSNKKSWERKNSGAMISIERKKKKFGIKIDFNSHSSISMLKAKIPLSDIDILLVSHAHEDHLNYRFFASKIGDCCPRADALFAKKPTIVYGPKGVIDTITEMLIRRNFFPLKSKKKNALGYYQFYSILNTQKKILTLCEVQEGTIINPLPNLEIKFIPARHDYQSAYSDKGFGKKAFGFLLRDNEIEKTFFYITDYFIMNEIDKKYLWRALQGYKVDLFILGMPLPFSKKNVSHTPLNQSLKIIKQLQKNNETSKKPIIVLTHLSDRWFFPEVVRRAKKVFKKYNFPIWLPPQDGVKIELNKKNIIKKSNW